ncbi:class I SAM-dependent methyltransferase [Kordiimonas gwangyangensis]|uniref:class I SAM-dependent methyltransferase n=1 Tax=Kordiimonas gwangyangensis TaxID=288022 RepID=UPI00037A0D64|nr:class I SAM-dependent methyltransferase [Kordiimonas gwangyangensis]
MKNLGDSGTVRRLNWLAKTMGAKTYLEIGVLAGKTFRNVRVKTKHAVDPNFLFDPSEFEDRNTCYYQMPSDEYFAHHIGERQYDLVFLDGLHTYEQTFRDFCAVLPHTHARSVILIDDTVPKDPYSALPDGREAERQKEAAGHVGGGWNGDIYKLIFAIHDFFPTLSYVTINQGKGQTAVWRQPRPDFAPLMNSHESISRMTWHDMQENLAIMKLEDRDAALERVASGIFRK